MKPNLRRQGEPKLKTELGHVVRYLRNPEEPDSESLGITVGASGGHWAVIDLEDGSNRAVAVRAWDLVALGKMTRVLASLPLPPHSLDANKRSYWRRQRDDVEQFRNASTYLWRQAWNLKRARLSIAEKRHRIRGWSMHPRLRFGIVSGVFWWRNRRHWRDPTNLGTGYTTKTALDAAVNAKLLDGDRCILPGSFGQGIDRERPRFDVELQLWIPGRV